MTLKLATKMLLQRSSTTHLQSTSQMLPSSALVVQSVLRLRERRDSRRLHRVHTLSIRPPSTKITSS